MENKSQKIKVLEVLIDAHKFNQTWYGYELPLGYATTGSLHNATIGGTNARVHIIMLRRSGIDIRYVKFPYINKRTGQLANPEVDGIKDEKIIETKYSRIIDGYNKPLTCHCYCILTPLNLIDAEKGKLIKKRQMGLFEKADMGF